MKRVQQVLVMAFALAFVMLAVGMAADQTGAKTATANTNMAMTNNNLDPVKVAPDIVRQVFDNNSVRVLEFDFKPGTKTPTFSMGDHTVYFEADGKFQVTDANGTTKDIEAHAGEVLWMPAGSRTVENVGTAETKCVVTELKGKAHMAMTSHTGTRTKHTKTASNTSNKGM
jgi:quercetin dioxygenase-like cupin family protein